MPKVIKPGKKEFIGTCGRCGCEFSYTLEELKAQYPLNISCPECGREYYHPDQSSSSNETLGEEIKDSFITGCPVCGGQMVVDDSVVLPSNPPQYLWRCQKCGHTESHFCNDVMITNNSIEKDQIKRSDWFEVDKDGYITKECLDRMNRDIENYNKGIVSDPIDFDGI